MRPPPKADSIQTGHHEPADDVEDDDESGQAGARKSDPELLVMGRTLKLLGSLEGPARARVVRWLGDRFAAEP